jgi:hypothetical protein
MMVIACSLVLACVPSIRDFSSITPLFSDHMAAIGVTENNGVTLSQNHERKVHEPETKYARNSHYSQIVQMRQFENDAPHNLI